MVLYHINSILSHSLKACGDGVVDVLALGSLNEQCDDGGTANGDGCDSLCQLEPINSPYSYSTSTPFISLELYNAGTWISPTYQICNTPYVVNTGATYTLLPGGYVCYKGRHCLDCLVPKFPGYPIVRGLQYTDSPYGFLAQTN